MTRVVTYKDMSGSRFIVEVNPESAVQLTLISNALKQFEQTEITDIEIGDLEVIQPPPVTTLHLASPTRDLPWSLFDD